MTIHKTALSAAGEGVRNTSACKPQGAIVGLGGKRFRCSQDDAKVTCKACRKAIAKMEAERAAWLATR